jgi:5'(3')-deoxyribonucleotidase
MNVRSLLGSLNDAQGAGEARYYAKLAAASRSLDEGSISEYLTCGHVNNVAVLQAALADVPTSRTDAAPAPRLRILCDADGVLVDFVGLVLDYVYKAKGLSYLPSAIDQWDCFAALGLQEHWPYFREQCDRLQLCRSMRPMLGAAEFLAGLRARGEVAICTTPMTPGWLTQRAEWLEAFGVPLKDQIHCHAKQDLARFGTISSPSAGWDVLIDDKVENCEAFKNAGGLAFCITAAYNTHCSALISRGDWRACLAWLDGLK